jgi:predicted MFS family arabinose efflux permease
MFYGWWIVAVSFVAQAFAVGLTTYAFGLFQKPVAAEFGASFQEVGLGMTLMSAAIAVFAPFLGRALDRRSIRGIMLLGGVLMAGGFGLMSVAPALWMLGLLFGAVVGLGMLALGPNASAKVVANWFVRRRGQALGICAAGTSAGGFLAPPLIALAIEAFGWRGALACLALVVALLALPMVWFVIVDRPEDRGLAPDGDDTAAQPATGSETPAVDWTFGALLRERNFWLIALSVGLCFATVGSLIVNLHPYATDLGIGDRRASLLISCLSAAGIVGKLIFGAVADRFDTRLGMWIAIGLLALYIGVLLSHPGYGVLVAASIVGGLALGGFLPVWGALIGVCYGRAAFGRVMGLMAPAMGPLNWAVYPLTGWIRDRTGSYDVAFAVFLVAIALAAVLLVFLRAPEREPGIPTRAPARTSSR